jgi:hypothetical protein
MTAGTLRIALLTHAVSLRGGIGIGIGIGFGLAAPALLPRFSRPASACRHLDFYRQRLPSQPLAFH